MRRSALRTGIYLAGGLFAAGAAVLWSLGCGIAGAWLAGWGAMLIIGMLIERWRYKPLASRPPGPGWIATGERFVDTETGKPVTVYHHPATGERRYIAP